MDGWSLLLSLCLWAATADSATGSGLSSTIDPTDGGAVTAANPAPGGTETGVPTGVWTTQVTEAASTGAASSSTEAPPAATVQPEEAPRACLCDLTPAFCDIGCCCDSVDCGVSDLRTVFTGCPQTDVPGLCIETWLMFRANVDSSLVTETDSLLCVRPQDDVAKSSRAPPAPAAAPPGLAALYHFSLPAAAAPSPSRAFYRVDDVIQTSFSSFSVRGLLRQPAPGAAASLCLNRNPAKFLRSSALSCTRVLTPQSCTTDPFLDARSYFSDLSLIKIPVADTTRVSDLLIPVKPVSEWPAPVHLNDSCFNAVQKVELIIGYTGRGELTSASVNVLLAHVDLTQTLMQTHVVRFQSDTPSPGGHAPADGLWAGSPVIGRSNGNVTTLTTLRASQGGECSNDPNQRAPILFTHSTVTGCTFSSPSTDCSELRSQVRGVLQGLVPLDEIAMNSGSRLSWTRVIVQECPEDTPDTCESGCLLPHSLSIRVLWARQGLLHLPQNYILGAKYIFQCRKVKCPVSSHLVLTTEVTFADSTLFPSAPRSSPEPSWKFPFGFFSRGATELDGH